MSFWWTLAIFAAVLVLAAVWTVRAWLRPRGASPFAVLATPAQADPAELSYKDKQKILRQGYSASKVPANLDAIVIGSGISGLTCAALLAKAGQRVLVLEQHDRAGGNMHTFVEQEYEFDTGVHYCGQFDRQTLTRFLLQQISARETVWAPMDRAFDRVVIDFARPRQYDIMGGKEYYKAGFLLAFPDEADAIDKWFDLMDEASRSTLGWVALKLLPIWLVRVLKWTGLVRLLTRFDALAARSVQETVEGLTTNADLRAVLMYSFGDYGTSPREAPLVMQLLLAAHYEGGASYPVGGPSMLPLGIIPVIEATGGAVLVRARVARVLVDAATGAAYGVAMEKDGAEIRARTIISSTGVHNTFTRLVPPDIGARYASRLAALPQGIGCFSLYVGLTGTRESLKLPAGNTWAFASNDLAGDYETYMRTADLGDIRAPPMVFISFPSAKDPTYASRCANLSTCEIITFAPYAWFEQWADEPSGKRSSSYKDVKQAFVQAIWRERVLPLFPRLEYAASYFDLGTPLTIEHYLAQPRGAIYGLDHCMARFAADWLRPQTDVPNLYLTGQDILTAGLSSAMLAGLITTSAVLNRNLFGELASLRKQARKNN